MDARNREIIAERAGPINVDGDGTLAEVIAMAQRLVEYCPSDGIARDVGERAEAGDVGLYDDSGELWGELFDRLQACAPVGMRFGCEHGSHGPLGYWPDDDARCDDMGIHVPEWVASWVGPCTALDIQLGGCASGSYMPAVTYADATRTMDLHGDAVLDYIREHTGDDVREALANVVRPGDSWAGIACGVLSYAVEVWSANVVSELQDCGYWR